MISKLRQACGAFVCLAFHGGWLCPLTDVAQVWSVASRWSVFLQEAGRAQMDPSQWLCCPYSQEARDSQRLTDMQCDVHGDGNSRGFVRHGGVGRCEESGTGAW